MHNSAWQPNAEFLEHAPAAVSVAKLMEVASREADFLRVLNTFPDSGTRAAARVRLAALNEWTKRMAESAHSRGAWGAWCTLCP